MARQYVYRDRATGAEVVRDERRKPGTTWVLVAQREAPRELTPTEKRLATMAAKKAAAEAEAKAAAGLTPGGEPVTPPLAAAVPTEPTRDDAPPADPPIFSDLTGGK